MSDISVRNAKTVKGNFIKTTSYDAEDKKDVFIRECNAISDMTIRKLALGFSGITLSKAKQLREEAIEDDDRILFDSLTPIINFYTVYSVKTAKAKKKVKDIDDKILALQLMIDVESTMSSLIEGTVESLFGNEYNIITNYRIRRGVIDNNSINVDNISNLSMIIKQKEDFKFFPNETDDDEENRIKRNLYELRPKRRILPYEYFGYDIDYANFKMMLGRLENLEPNLETIK